MTSFFAPYGCHLRLFETELDLIQQELDKGTRHTFFRVLLCFQSANRTGIISSRFSYVLLHE